ncbi:hypothetical protein DFR70_108162 [Nocardia tenerifensis]|uniref:Uncharacterized protein n=1 Tax=Nocardia tenerifensis TaxID=228006 RepID=A0A318K290_9NOCA|nr:hypothetical protein [Nocardia tenerifensis]PXX61604.1 hypothetical protein DFR70_108162 [Nocardia tenerifensis]
MVIAWALITIDGSMPLAAAKFSLTMTATPAATARLLMAFLQR